MAVYSIFIDQESMAKVLGEFCRIMALCPLHLAIRQTRSEQEILYIVQIYNNDLTSENECNVADTQIWPEATRKQLSAGNLTWPSPRLSAQINKDLNAP